MPIDDPNPADLTDEQLDAIINGEELEEKPVEPQEEEKPEAPKPDEKVEEEEEKPEEDEEEKEEPEKEGPEKPVSRREQLRVNQLIERMKEGSGKPQEPTKQEKPEALKYEDELEADEETLQKLNDDREKYAEERYQQGLAQAKAMEERQNAFEFKSMLQSEEPRVLAKYPFMDKDNQEAFDPEATSAMVSKYMNFVGFDANTGSPKNPLSYYEFVDAEMEFVQALAEKMNRESQTNVVKQAANAGLRPSGSAPSKSLNLSKAPENMSDEELDAIIAQAIPQK